MIFIRSPVFILFLVEKGRSLSPLELIIVDRCACRLKDPAFRMTMTWSESGTTPFALIMGGSVISRRYITIKMEVSRSSLRSMFPGWRYLKVSSNRSCCNPSTCGEYWKRRTSRLSHPYRKKQDSSAIGSKTSSRFYAKDFCRPRLQTRRS